MNNKNKIKGRAPRNDSSSSFSTDSFKPKFCLEFFSGSMQYLHKDEKIALITTLYNLSRLSWSDLTKAPRHGLGYEKINDKNLSEKIPIQLKDKEANLIAFRYNGKKPMIGCRLREIFHIIWLDIDFSLYNHG